MALYIRAFVTFLIFEMLGSPYFVFTQFGAFGLGRRHSNRSVATMFAITNPTVTTKPPKHVRHIASKLFIFDSSNENFTSDESQSQSSESKTKVGTERESLNERQERIRRHRIELENQEHADFDGRGVRARGGIYEERKKR